MVTGKATRTVVTACPDCEDKIILTGEIKCGRKVVSPHCGVDLENVNTDPVELDWLYEDADYADYEKEEEDW